ncbi:MAG: polysaccharide deacetylase family protein [Candidatus Poribacteria bacterium]|nr:polysaccharide deacetylase family protein [Candidatus Poribacteria bacterium]
MKADRCNTPETADRHPIPDRLIVLTFDDGVKSQFTFAAPLLKQYGFGATFFITEGLGFLKDKQRYMTWEEVWELHLAGFEIGNHTRHHRNVNDQSQDELAADLDHIDQRCKEYGIPVPQIFCYPGYSNGPGAVEVLMEKGFCFARRGVAPEFSYDSEGGRGPAYDPTHHHPLLIPTTGASGPNWKFDDFVWGVEQARDGKITVLTFHGVPDLDHPWVDTSPQMFEACMRYLNENGYTVIPLGGLEKYISPARDRI